MEYIIYVTIGNGRIPLALATPEIDVMGNPVLHLQRYEPGTPPPEEPSAEKEQKCSIETAGAADCLTISLN